MHELLSLAQVSRLWNAFATPWIYRTVMIDLSPTSAPSTAELLKGLLDDNRQLRSWTRALGIAYEPPANVKERQRWQASHKERIVDAGQRALESLG